MTYFGFLAIFLALPIAILLAWHLLRDTERSDSRPWHLRRVPALVIALHVIIALLYTTPWDNYLVATGVWWYNPARVTGLTLGWVPIEEYTFFVLQPILSGLLLLILLQKLPATASQTNAGTRIRLASVATLTVIWLVSLITLLSGWDPGTYLSLELVWALPPIALQFAFGADILWRYRKGVLSGVLLPTLFLSAADTLAIGIGIWTIDPAQSLHLLIAGVLPVEEFIFFLLTNTLIVFGVTLSLAPESRPRLISIRQRLQRRTSPQNAMRRSADW